MSTPDDSILNSVKKFVGITPDYTEFDEEIKVHINNAIATLSQLGVDVDETAFINDTSSGYEDVFGDKIETALIKTYIPLKVRMGFDPPGATNVSNAMNNLIAETEWRILMQVSNNALNGGDGDG